MPVAFLVFCRSPPARRGRREEAVTDPPARLDFLAAARGSHAAPDNDQKWADLPCFLLPFPSLLAVRTTVTCKGKNTHAKLPILFPFFFFFFRSTLSCLLLLVFCSSLLQVADGFEVRASL